MNPKKQFYFEPINAMCAPGPKAIELLEIQNLGHHHSKPTESESVF